MGQRLAKLVLLTTSLGGCSLLYDPDGLPPAADAMIPPYDVSPCELEVTDLAPTNIFEGMGVGGSRPALIVITGKNFASQSASVSIVAAPGSSRTPMLEIDPAKIEVGGRGNQIAVPITLPVDTTFPAGESVTLDVTVAQDCPAGSRTGTISGKLTLKGLDELDGGTVATIPLTGGLHEYSRIDVGTASTLEPAANQTLPLILHSTSSVKIAKDISLDAGPMPQMAQEPCPGGPSGGTGGKGGSGLGGTGSSGGGPYPGVTAGAPGRFESADLALARFLANNQNRGSGGAGGNGAVVGGQGGRGGGGGGAIAISAGGDLEVGAISARGFDGENGALGGQKGGGGSGGVILLRAGGALKAGNLDVNGGGAGQDGRARYDAGGTAMLSAGELGDAHYRGPMFVDPPLTTRSRTPDFTISGKPLSGFRYFILDEAGGASQAVDEMIGSGGTARITLKQDLPPGSSQICLVVAGGDGTSDTRNCIYIAYLE